MKTLTVDFFDAKRWDSKKTKTKKWPTSQSIVQLPNLLFVQLMPYWTNKRFDNIKMHGATVKIIVQFSHVVSNDTSTLLGYVLSHRKSMGVK